MARRLRVPRTPLLILLGTGLLGVVAITHWTTGSLPTLGEWAVLVYAVLLVFATPHLHHRIGRLRVDSAVGWSFSLVLTPLLLFILHTQVVDPVGGTTDTISDRLVGGLVLLPATWGLSATGLPARLAGDEIVIRTTDGSLGLGVGLVCAGLYPMIVFLGVLGHHAWRLAPRRRLLWTGLLVGLAGLYLTNLIRLVLLVKIGTHWGPETLHMVHANLGWLLFASFLFLFWNLFMQEAESVPSPREPAHPHEGI